MVIDLYLENKEYMKLAIRVISDKASFSEKARLDELLKAKPELEDDFEGLKQEMLKDDRNEITELLLKSLLGKTTPEEQKELRSLETSDNNRWRRCLAFALTLQVVAESLQKARKSPPLTTKMPDHIREKLMANLRESRGK